MTREAVGPRALEPAVRADVLYARLQQLLGFNVGLSNLSYPLADGVQIMKRVIYCFIAIACFFPSAVSLRFY